jgi:enolase-phosphatase E1
MAQAGVILLDIEGTTTPIDFVHQTLFAYAKENFGAFLRANDSHQEVRKCVASLKTQRAVDDSEGRRPPAWLAGDDESQIASAVEYGLWLIDRDSKIGSLKALQGLIWQEGYRAGKLKGQVYSDVPPAFKRWHGQGKDISLYSSGSELAQRLLFGTTESGDLTRFINAFFDTRVGPKTSADSYKRIAIEKGKAPEEFLFLSDTCAELDAARVAGMQTAQLVRVADNKTPSGGHSILHNLDALR